MAGVMAYIIFSLVLAIPLMIVWAFFYWLFPQSPAKRLGGLPVACALLAFWRPGLLALYFVMCVLLSFLVIILFEYLLAKDQQTQ
ncbi:MAG: hypothetical protein AAF559_12875 [Pseudomonadota bacterium]